MSALDVVAGLAATVAGFCLALRGYMLKPAFTTWADAPNAVAMGLLVLSIAMGGAAVSIFGGAGVTAREALVYVVLATVSAIMLWNVHRQRPRPPGEAERRARERSEFWPI